MSRNLCIHGHFYQPPREDPWLGTILPEDSAAPSLNWNTRITRESYAPLAWARRLNGNGAIADILNCYEWMSFNVGPTLLRWMEKESPDTYQRILQADKVSAARWGHGNAIAQIYHHIIMPLASQQDKEIEVTWAIDDFAARFGRLPEGMWLAESAADIATLETLADKGILFTILAPRQAKAVAKLGEAAWKPVDSGSLDISRPYLVELPSGKSISVFFYDGPLSQAVAFEQLLQDGESFWQRLSEAAGDGLLSVCTDGETYGHHFTFGEMALAHTLAQGYSGRDNITLTNYAAYLANHPAEYVVQLHEPSSWSCVHGVERWRSNCGCKDGGHPHWNQEWRTPLRNALNTMKDFIDAHFTATAKNIFTNPKEALLAYGCVLAGSTGRQSFTNTHFTHPDNAEQVHTGWLLLAMQEQALAAFASCAWFFDDISRIEPVNGMTYALRAIELAEETGAEKMQEAFTNILSTAVSNKQELGNGKTIFTEQVLPRRESDAALILQAMLMLWAEKRLPCPYIKSEVTWQNVSISILPTDAVSGTLSGEANIRIFPEPEGKKVNWEWTPPTAGTIRKTGVTLISEDGARIECGYEELPRNKRQAITARMIEMADKVHRDAMAEDAANAIALFEQWEEAQYNQHKAHHWQAMLPALGIAFIKMRTISQEQEKAVARYLQQLLEQNSGAQTIITDWLRARVEQLLEENLLTDETTLEKSFTRAEEIVKKAQAIMPDVELWGIQNCLWAKGMRTRKAKDLAETLGFVV